MANRSAVLFQNDTSRLLDTGGQFVLGGDGEIEIAPGVVVPAAHAATHAAAGTDPILGPLALQASTGLAGTAPLKIASGPLMAAPESGAIEHLVDKLYVTIATGTSRKPIALWDSSGTSGRIPYTTTDGRLVDSANLLINTATQAITHTGEMTTSKLGVGTAVGVAANTKIVVGSSAGVFGASTAAAHFIDNTISATINVQNTNASGYAAFDLFNSSNTKTATIAWSNSGGSFANTLWISTRAANDLWFGTNTTERMRITSTGEVRIANLTAGKPVWATTSGELTTTPPAGSPGNYKRHFMFMGG